jgi:hypothetical protein
MEDSIGDWLAGSSAFGMSRMAVVFDFNRDKALIRSLSAHEGGVEYRSTLGSLAWGVQRAR